MKAQSPGGGKGSDTDPPAAAPLEAVVMKPIGVVRTPWSEKSAAPRQAVASPGTKGRVELLPGMGFEDALDGIEAWSHLWIVFLFHLNTGWKPKVQPPRSESKRGLFATRSPHRPNPIGMSVVKLEAVSGLTLHVCEVDMVDGTPVLDINPSPSYEVRFTPRAEAELDFLGRSHSVELAPLFETALALGPEPHAYRRIRPQPDGTSLIAVKEWRARFRAQGRCIEVLSIHSGYGARDLEGDDPALAVHRAFVARFDPQG